MVRITLIVTGPVLLCVSVMAVVIMLGLTLVAAVMAAMRHALNNKLGIVLLGHIGELFQKADGRPQLVVAVIAPGWHAGHLDPVFEDPEQLRRRVMVGCMDEIGGLWIEAICDVAFRDTRCAVADGAVRCEMFRADQQLCGIVEPGWHLDVGGREP
jgi:hypothetical protein